MVSQNHQVVTYNQQQPQCYMATLATVGNPYEARHVLVDARDMAGVFGYGVHFAVGLCPVLAWEMDQAIPRHETPGWDEMPLGLVEDEQPIEGDVFEGVLPYEAVEEPSRGRLEHDERVEDRKRWWYIRWQQVRRAEVRRRRALVRQEFRDLEALCRHEVALLHEAAVQRIQASADAIARRVRVRDIRNRIDLNKVDADEEESREKLLREQRAQAAQIKAQMDEEWSRASRMRAAQAAVCIEEESKRTAILADESARFELIRKQAAVLRPRSRDLGGVNVLQGFVASVGAELIPGGRMRAYTTSRVSYGTYDVEPFLPFALTRLTGPVAYWSGCRDFNVRPGDAIYSRVEGPTVGGKYVNGSRDLSTVHAIGDGLHEFPVRFERHVIDKDIWQVLRIMPSGFLDVLSVDVDDKAYRTVVSAPDPEGIVYRLKEVAGLDMETAVRVGYEIVAETIESCDVAGLNEVKQAMLRSSDPSDPCTVARALAAERTRVGALYAADPSY